MVAVLLAVFSLGIASPAGAAMSNESDETWMTNEQVTAMVRIGNTIYLGGNFTAVRSRYSGGESVERRYLAAIDATTGALVRSWAPRAGSRVYAMVTDGSTIYIGGAFRNINGQNRQRLAALDPDTGALRSWNPGTSSTVKALALYNGRIFAGGKFTQANGQSRTGLAAFSAATGALDPDWTPSAGDGEVRAIAPRADGSRIYVGGDFLSLNGVARANIGAVTADTGNTVSWPAVSNGIVFDLETSSGRVYAARGGGGGRVTSYRDDTGATLWYQSANGDIQDVEYHNGWIYVGGHFALQGTCRTCGPVAFAGHDLNIHIGRVSTTGQLDTNWHPVFSGFPGVWEILPTGNRVHLGGSFKKAGNRWQQGYARFTDPTGSPDDTEEPPPPPITEGNLIAAGSTWRYLDTGQDPGSGWRGGSYDDSSWASGLAQLGYGDGDESTVITRTSRAATYFRRSFQVDNLSSVNSVTLRVQRDDGAVVYLNGTEIARTNMPTGTITNTTWAAATVDNDAESAWHEYTIPVGALNAGGNTIAVSVHNRSATSSDLGFDLELSAQ